MIDPSSFLRRTAITMLTACMIVTLSEPALATTVDEAQATKTEAEESLSSVNQEIATIKSKQEALQNQIDELDSELVEILIEIEATQSEIENKKIELEQDKQALADAEDAEHEHYISMKERICYMYENGNVSVLESLLGSKDFSEMINKVSNWNAMYSLDRELLDEYINTRQEIELLVETVEQEEEDLEELEITLQGQQDDLEYEKEIKQDELSDFDQQLEDAESLASQYRSTISEMNAAIQAIQIAEAESESHNSAESYYEDDTTTETANESYVSNDSSDNVQTYNEETEEVYETSYSSSGSAVADYACQFVGNPYVWGGSSLTNGCDCSGFVMSVYAHFGVSLPHSSSSLRSVGYGVSASDIQPGDIVCYDGHCAIYIGGGQIVHASNSKPYPEGGIKISSNYAYRTILAIRRIF